MFPQPGQNLLLNNRSWTIRRVRSAGGRKLEIEVMGGSPAAQGMTRRLNALRYDDELFIEQHRTGYWVGHLEQGWVEHEQGAGLVCKPATSFDLFDAHTRHPAGGKLKNEFSWSYSRAEKYKQCPRAYYYHYYAAWEGWQSSAPAPVKKAYLLKNLTDLSRWVGNLVHESIQYALAQLKSGRAIPENDLIEHMHSRAQTDFTDSQSGRYRQKPNRFTGFQEHYYQTGPSKDTWQAAWSIAEERLSTFLQSTLYAHLRRQSPATFLEIETLQSFPVAQTKVWVQMDFARQEEDTIVIYDWKTGTVNDTAVQLQLGIYGLYAQHTWPQAVKNGALRGIVYGIAGDQTLEVDLNNDQLQETQTFIEASISQLKSLLLDPQNNLAEISRFPMIEDLAICQQCQFKELCGRDTQPNSSTPHPYRQD
jgi:hypothetical protein